MRGRVMALYSVVFLGSTAFGGPLAGWLSQAYDPRVALLLSAAPGSPPPGPPAPASGGWGAAGTPPSRPVGASASAS